MAGAQVKIYSTGVCARVQIGFIGLELLRRVKISMCPRGNSFLAGLSFIVAVVPAAVYGYASGPPPFVTGNSKDGGATCNQSGCHSGSALNLAGGKVQITLPGAATYVPGQTQKITVTVSDPVQRTWGFQLTARVQSTNAQTGDLNPADASTLVVCADDSIKSTTCPAAFNTQFIEHSGPKSGTGSGTFTFNWTAPATDVGTVIFYAAGNAANGNGADTGDHIYTTTQQLTAAAAGNPPAISLVAPASGTTPTITQGSWVSIYGTNLADTTYTLLDSDRIAGAIPTTLKGVSVQIDGKAAFVYFVNPNQVNVQAPDDSRTGTGFPVTITTSAGTSSPGSVTLSKFAPTLFLFDGKHPVGVIPTASGGFYGGGTYDFLGAPNSLPFNTRAVKRGEFIELFGTGFGPTAATVPSGQPFDGASATTTAATILIGGIAVNPSFTGLRYAGEYQINVVVPANVPIGDQAITVSIGGVSTQSGLFINVQ